VIFFWRGFYGVNLFFVISGFVILMTASRCSLRDFIISRAARLLPGYWFCAALSYLLVRLHDGISIPLHEPIPSLPEAIANLTMLQMFFGVENIDGSYWTLAYELAFYCAVGLLLARKWLPHIEIACLAWLFVDAALAFVPLKEPVQLARMVGYAPMFVVGMMLFRLWSGTATRLMLPVLALGVASVFVLPGGRERSLVLLCMLVVAIAVFWQPAILRWRPLTFLGAISYPLYLLHQNVGFIELHWLNASGLPPYVALAIATVATILLAWAVERVIEVPGRRGLRRLLSVRLAPRQAALDQGEPKEISQTAI
jgi:peptidoglycan/LPS O-acetylase OafA/YrhL